MLPSFCCYEPTNPQNHPRRREVQEGGTNYTNGWFMLMFGGNQHNSVKQLSFNLKMNLKKSPPPRATIYSHHCSVTGHLTTEKYENGGNRLLFLATTYVVFFPPTPSPTPHQQWCQATQ